MSAIGSEYLSHKHSELSPDNFPANTTNSLSASVSDHPQLPFLCIPSWILSIYLLS